ncbi:hypothetical protein EJ03DRAFT_66956 [Teratosphaeria nubilosa]|uniref:Secreted protein n=1 Tax=Teratosphaeria nubilosa TaxID=161662 RepID=A0A6G1LCN7_9PEZI|nr:hypothetical protein EJ03DRAFT_66956 [Teratosphaeria nubilosa]
MLLWISILMLSRTLFVSCAKVLDSACIVLRMSLTLHLSGILLTLLIRLTVAAIIASKCDTSTSNALDRVIAETQKLGYCDRLDPCPWLRIFPAPISKTFTTLLRTSLRSNRYTKCFR